MLLARCGCFCAVVLVGAPAQGATAVAGASLEAENSAGAESCPSAEALAARTLALGLPPSEPREKLSIQVTFRREGTDFYATLRTRGPSSGERELTDVGPTCEALAAATAVTLAVLLDLRPRENTARPVTRSAPPARPAQRKPGVFRYASLRAEQDATYGVLGPAFSLAFGGALGVRLARFEVTLGGFAFLERTFELPPGTVDVGLAGGSLGFCAAAVRTERLELGACASFLVGRFHGSGHGFYTDHEHAELWLASGIGATLAVELSRRWAVRLGLEALVPFRQQEPVVDGVGLAYDPLPVGFMLRLGPELRIF
jgi:hypothetical protein